MRLLDCHLAGIYTKLALIITPLHRDAVGAQIAPLMTIEGSRARAFLLVHRHYCHDDNFDV